MTFLRRIIWNITNIPLSVLRHALQNMSKSSKYFLSERIAISSTPDFLSLKMIDPLNPSL